MSELFNLCPIWDCQCQAGDDTRLAFARVNLVLDEKGDSPEYRAAWADFERAIAVRIANCQCGEAT